MSDIQPPESPDCRVRDGASSLSEPKKVSGQPCKHLTITHDGNGKVICHNCEIEMEWSDESHMWIASENPSRWPNESSEPPSPAPEVATPRTRAKAESLLGLPMIDYAVGMERHAEDMEREAIALRARNEFLELFTPKTNLGLIEVVADLRTQLASMQKERDEALKQLVDDVFEQPHKDRGYTCVCGEWFGWTRHWQHHQKICAKFLAHGRDFDTALADSAEKDKRIAELERTLRKIDDLRNSIVAFQTINWSEHVYPLVAALNEAGFHGLGYDAAQVKFLPILERANAAEAEVATLRAELAKVSAERDALQNFLEAIDYNRIQVHATGYRGRGGWEAFIADPGGHYQEERTRAIGHGSGPLQALQEAVKNESGSSPDFAASRQSLRSERDALALRVEGLEKALTKAAEKFEEYTRLHASKGTPEGGAKAAANLYIAGLCRAALNPPTA